MNYYEHHIGDYAEATAHLTFIEDATYSRLIRKYYATEKPLPMDVKFVQRLINARSKEEKNAVISVLNEFFTLTDDGWRQERCDHEIARFKDRQIKARRSAEGRWQSSSVEQILSDSTTISVCDRNANALPTQCSPNTRHQTPNTNLHTPDKQNNGAEKKNEETSNLSPAQIVQLFAKEGINIPLDDERINEMLRLDISEKEVADAILQAKDTRRRALSSTPINVGFVMAILKGMRRKSQTINPVEDIWWKSNEGIDAKGRELGMRAQGSESYDAFKTRIFAELRKRQEAVNAG
ncbi:YdaU family protein [Polynucleobacter paneuropaeus]|uniref:YdaU family protein n=1 Tax=Polynucleobacter paneuropaeus TaxID=2527775 RepID=A0AAE3CH73_9BURK|nr:YdaU family protein [Polynucleobacter paneuropaeus]MBT8590880.1 YdaU family protein [Polynucleobacter paneuropaeus]MBT8596271.1 YdaU family protein [Polynucleobacter paneuropaeus]MBT8598084.1 YdaU family protein [Polynucleobacter paneuropaeus]